MKKVIAYREGHWEKGIEQISETYEDSKKRRIVLCEDKKGYFAQVRDESGLKRIDTLNNKVKPEISLEELLKKIKMYPKKQWVLTYIPEIEIVEISMPPSLLGGGKRDGYTVDGDMQNPWKNMDFNQTKRWFIDNGYTIKHQNQDGVSFQHPKDPRHRSYNVDLSHGKDDPHVDVNYKGEKFRFNIKPSAISKNNIQYKTIAYKSREVLFQTSVQSENLSGTYNNNHAKHPIRPRGAKQGSIGGVGNEVGIIEGLKDSLDEALNYEQLFLIRTKDGKAPFSNSELQQLIRELAIGIYVHDTVPFFSLHFNADGSMFPIIHPVYENTLVGRVIGMLDYIMKGFLNGGIYNEKFAVEWENRPTKDVRTLRSKMIDFKAYCERRVPGHPVYITLRQLQKASGISIYKEEVKKVEGGHQTIYKNRFQTSFRIIAKQETIRKTENMFEVDDSFDVFYTIEGTPEFDRYLKEHEAETGTQPAEYVKLNEVYKAMAEQIKEVMPKLPMCRDYFAMLSVINFMSTYFRTLKEIGKVSHLASKPIYRFYALPDLQPTGFDGGKVRMWEIEYGEEMIKAA